MKNTHIINEVIRRMGPLAVDHPMINGLCIVCKVPFKAGEWVTLVPIGPGDDSEARRRARDGRSFTAVAVAAHWACATGDEDDQ